MGVPGLNEAMDEVPQVLSRADTGAAQALATQDREPDLHLIEPRAMSGQPVEGDCGPLSRTPVQHRLFLMIAGVVHNQMPATVRGAGAQRTQEVTKLPIGMTLIALREDLPSPHVKGGKEIDGAMAEILKLLTFDQAGPHGQSRMQAFQGLDVGLLIKTENPTLTRGMQVELENLGHLLLKQGIGTGQEVAHPMRLEHQLRQNPLYRGRTPGQNFPA